MGERAATILGFQMIVLYKPMIIIDINQMSTIGANKNPTLWVPACCKVNRPTNIMQERNTTPSTIRGILIVNALKLYVNYDK